MALPCVHGGMGIIGYKNHLKTNPEDHKTLYVKYHVKLGFLSGLSTKNHHQNLSPFCRHSHFSGMGAQPPTEFEDYAFRRHKSQMFQGFESYDDLISPFVGGIAPFPGPLDGPRLTEAARMAVELHNNQQVMGMNRVKRIPTPAPMRLGGIYSIDVTLA
ncbi:uncharacterized protein LOC132300464 isoform X2 [Cornus florida]|uniref:uncharacterized protein LOC132300464 isoform X2 n=1 Tax=Cornus florida TaxID=4283 RepID=UPI0028A01B03|nr:uncharacterized protein LOC132300464 isoform X2 [Cornus florida]